MLRLHPNYQRENALQELIEALKNASKQREIVLSYFNLRNQYETDKSI